MRPSTLLAIAALSSIPLTAALSVPSFADQESQVIKSCKQDPHCHVGKKDKIGGVAIIIDGSDAVISCVPGNSGCIVVTHTSLNPSVKRHVQSLLGATTAIH